jgi:hypothetical protein
MCAEYGRWFCMPSDLEGLTPLHARDLIIECFFQAQHEAIQRDHAAVGHDTDLEAIRLEAREAVRSAFTRTGGDFDNPDKASLELAVELLIRTAASMGTPADIIRHHEQQIAMMLDQLAS